MIIATRLLKLRDPKGDIEIPIRIFLPELSEDYGWVCPFEIDWPDGRMERFAGGGDSMQALILAISMIGVIMCTSDYHNSGNLNWSGDWKGYGFPVPQGARDLLIGHDAKFF